MAADILAVLRADTSEFTAKMAEAKGEVKGLSDSGSSNFSKLGTIGKYALAGIGAAVVSAGAYSVDLASKFQSTVASIAANADISTSAAQRIGAAFLDTAGKTIFSGQQIASAYAGVAGQLGATQGKALSASQAMTVMNAAMDLAEGTGTNLNSATAALAATMQAYGIKAAGATSVTNVLYNASRITGTGVQAVAAAMDKLHSTLGDVTPPISQVGGLMVELAQHGETGRKALSAINTTLDGILAPTKAAAAAQQSLGVSFYNSSGQFVGLGSAIAQLQPKLAGMTQQQQLAALKAVGFGTANKALLSTVLSGPAAFDKATAAVSRQNSAHEAAVKQSQTLQHQIETLKAQAEDYGVKIGQALIPKLEALVKITTSVVSWFTKHKDAAMALGIVIGGALTTAIAAYVVLTGVKFVRSTQQAFQSVQTLTKGAIEAAKGISSMAIAVARNIATMVASGASWVAEQASQLAESAANTAAWVAEHTVAAASFIAENVAMAASATAAFIAENAATLGIVAGIAALVAGIIWMATHWKETWKIVMDVVHDAWDFIRPVFNFIKTLGLDYIRIYVDVLKLEWQAAWTIISTVLQAAWAVLQPVFNFIKTLGIDLIANEIRGLQVIWNAVWSAVSAAVQVAWSAINGYIQAGIGFIRAIPGEVEAVFKDAGTWLYDTGKAIIEGLVNGIKAAIGDVTSAVKSVVSTVKSVVTLGGLIGSPSPWFTMVGQMIGQGLVNGIVGSGSQVSSATRNLVNTVTGAGSSSFNAGITPIAGAGQRVGASPGAQVAQVAVTLNLENTPVIQALQTAVLQYGRGVPTVFGAAA